MKQSDDKSRRCFLKVSSMLGLAGALNPGAISELLEPSRSKTSKEEIMAQTTASRAADKNAIRPFHVNFPAAELTDLRRRINATRWPEAEAVADASQGVQLAPTE